MDLEYRLTQAGVIGREGDSPSVLSGRKSGRQGGTAERFSALVPEKGTRAVLISKENEGF